MIFDEVRRKISSLMGELIPPGGFSMVAKEADSRGRFTNRQIIDILIILYTYLESNQTNIDGKQDISNQKDI